MVKVRFLLFYSELASTDPWCNMLQTLLGRKNEQALSDEHPHTQVMLTKKLYVNDCTIKVSKKFI